MKRDSAAEGSRFRFRTWLVLCSAVACLGACGGDGGESSVGPAPARTDGGAGLPWPPPGVGRDMGPGSSGGPGNLDAQLAPDLPSPTPIVPDAALVSPPVVVPDAAPAELGSAPMTQDPCQGETTRGRCLSPTQVRICATPTGNDTPSIVDTTCQPFETCEQTAGGAACVARPGQCESGTRQCQSPGQIAVCQDTRWQVLDCPGGCLDTALGDFCRLRLETRTYTGKLEYEAHRPKDDLSDWQTSPFVAPMAGVVLTSFRADQLVDADITDDAGNYTLQIPTQPAAEDRLLVQLVHPNAAKTGLAFAVARPDLPDGLQNPRNAHLGAPKLWQWLIDPQRTPSGGTLRITEALGSGAVRVFDNLRFAYTFARAAIGRQGEPLVVFMRPNTDWSCGACFTQLGARVENLSFDSRMVIPMLAEDRAYWSDSTIMHELGHWVMGSHSVPPGEGGRHCVGVPVLPGIGWSEGWASGFSALARKSPLFVNKQRGTMFWIDVDKRTISRNRQVLRPVAAQGLMQPIDEHEVAGMLYRLGTGDPAVGTDRLLQVLASPHMNQPPFARGYRAQRWRDVDGDCRPVGVTMTNENVPVFADYLDALRCNGVAAASIDAVTEPAMHFPYPSNAPLCK